MFVFKNSSVSKPLIEKAGEIFNNSIVLVICMFLSLKLAPIFSKKRFLRKLEGSFGGVCSRPDFANN